MGSFHQRGLLEVAAGEFQHLLCQCVEPGHVCTRGALWGWAGRGQGRAPTLPEDVMLVLTPGLW